MGYIYLLRFSIYFTFIYACINRLDSRNLFGDRVIASAQTFAEHVKLLECVTDKASERLLIFETYHLHIYV
jgi:hypothetical protein